MIAQAISNHSLSQLQRLACLHSLKDHYYFLRGALFSFEYQWFHLLQLFFSSWFCFDFLLSFFAWSKYLALAALTLLIIFLVIGSLAAVTFLEFKWSLTILRAIRDSDWLLNNHYLLWSHIQLQSVHEINKNIRTKTFQSDL